MATEQWEGWRNAKPRPHPPLAFRFAPKEVRELLPPRARPFKAPCTFAALVVQACWQRRELGGSRKAHGHLLGLQGRPQRQQLYLIVWWLGPKTARWPWRLCSGKAAFCRARSESVLGLDGHLSEYGCRPKTYPSQMCGRKKGHMLNPISSG